MNTFFVLNGRPIKYVDFIQPIIEMIRILLVSDVHCKTEHLKLVRSWIDKNIKYKIDVVLLLGDLNNLKGEEYTNKYKIKEAEGILNVDY